MNREFYDNIRIENEREKHYKELQKQYNEGHSHGLRMGLSAAGLIGGILLTAIGGPKTTDPLIDCDDGPRSGDFNLSIGKDEVFSTKAITGGDQITITGGNPGSISVDVAENVIVTFPNQQITGGSKLSLNPNSPVSLETNGIIMDVLGQVNGDSTNVSIDAKCKT